MRNSLRQRLLNKTAKSTVIITVDPMEKLNSSNPRKPNPVQRRFDSTQKLNEKILRRIG